MCRLDFQPFWETSNPRSLPHTTAVRWEKDDIGLPKRLETELRRCGCFEKSSDKIAKPDGLTLLAIRSDERRKSGILGECRRI